LRRAAHLVFFSVLLLLGACRRDRSVSSTFAPIETGRTAEPRKSSGCAAPSYSSDDTRESPRGARLTTAGERSLHVWGPSPYDPTKAYPLVLAFHGVASDGPGFQRWFKMEDYVGGAAFTVYPDAKGSWDLDGERDLLFLDAMLDALERAYCIDRDRVFAFGFSYGGRLVNHLGCKRPDKLKAIGIGGSGWRPEKGCSNIPVFVTHRTSDHVAPLAWGKEAAERWAVIDGCATSTTPSDARHGCVTWTGCRPAGAVTFCEDTDDNPAWPRAWHHTVREEHRALLWAWFQTVR
jgi:polyhydroxybutyrate depolymerase